MALIDEREAPAKPFFRGRLHEWGLYASVPAGIAAIVAAHSVGAHVAAAIYAASLTAMYAASAAYHRLPVSPTVRARLRRLDHSMIYVLIAGTYTPFVSLLFGVWWAVAILGVVWTGALLGIAVSIWRFDEWSKLGFALYLILGWVIVLALPVVLHSLSGGQIALLGAGGVVYTLGAIGVATKWPNPFPRIFGYHEVWHAMVLAASVCHYIAIVTLLRR